MEFPDDFNPIEQQGELETGGGPLGRMRQRRQLPAAGAGHRLVLIDEQGQPRSSGTAGVKYWAQGRAWVKVDVSDHVLQYTIPFSDLTGRAGFLAAIKVRSNVTDANLVTQSAVTSVKGYLEPALHETAIAAAGESAHAEGKDPVAALTDLQHNVESMLREAMVGKPVAGVPSWLNTCVESVVVTLDTATARHREDLVRSSRTGELLDAQAVNEIKQADHTVKLRDLWRKALGPHMTDPVARAVEVMISNPSPSNIASVSNQLNNAEIGLQEKILDVLDTLIESGYLHGTGDLPQAVEMLRNTLQRQTLAPASVGNRAQPTGGKAPSETSESDKQLTPLIEQPSQEKTDGDWSDD